MPLPPFHATPCPLSSSIRLDEPCSAVHGDGDKGALIRVMHGMKAAANMHQRRAGRPSARDAELKHLAMLEAALEEFARAGFHGASIRAIADIAGLSTRTLYNRYPDKATLFAACLEMSSLKDQQQLENKPGTLREQLVYLGRMMQARLNEDRHTRLARVIFREAASFPQLKDIAREQFHRFQLEPIQRVLQAHGFSPEQAGRLTDFYVVLAFQKWQSRVVYNEASMTVEEINAQIEYATDLFLEGALASRQA